MDLPERLRYWAQNEEMVDQHFTAHGRDCNAAADCVTDLLAALEVAEGIVDWALSNDADPGVRAAHRMICAAIAKARGL